MISFLKSIQTSSPGTVLKNSPVFHLEFPYNPLLSGLLINGNKLQGQAAAVELGIGKGKIDLLGFKVIHRAQAHGSFKFLFNSLIY